MKNRFMLAIVLSLGVLSGCSGLVCACTPPMVIANAGTDQAVTIGDTVNLDGSGSSTYEFSVTYLWRFTEKPASSQATLLNTTTLKPSFVPDVAGTYQIELEISVEQSHLGDVDELSVTVTNQGLERRLFLL